MGAKGSPSCPVALLSATHLEQGAWELVLVGRVGPQRVQLVELVVQELEHVHLRNQVQTIILRAGGAQGTLRLCVMATHIWGGMQSTYINRSHAT
eukprot:1158683-Pelagomonas_calceolata.AAC.4